MKRIVLALCGIAALLCGMASLSACSVQTFLEELTAEDSAVSAVSAESKAESSVPTPKVTVSVGSASGKKGDLVLVPVSVTADSGLVNADLYIRYDAARLRAVKQYDAAADKSYWATGGIWNGSVWAEEPEPGTLHVMLATGGEGLTEAGELFRLTFEVQSDLTEPTLLEPQITVCAVDQNGQDVDLAATGEAAAIAGSVQ